MGLTQYGVWAALALAIALPGVAAVVGMSEGIPHIADRHSRSDRPFFLLGYFLYASFYAALSAPFNTEQEAQQFVMIPGMMLILTSTTWFFAYNQPNGRLATVLSFSRSSRRHDVHADLRPDAPALADRDVRRHSSRDDFSSLGSRAASTASASSCTARNPRCPRSPLGATGGLTGPAGSAREGARDLERAGLLEADPRLHAVPLRKVRVVDRAQDRSAASKHA